MGILLQTQAAFNLIIRGNDFKIIIIKFASMNLKCSLNVANFSPMSGTQY